MLHPDYQYTPKLIHSMCFLIANGVYEVVLGSRILGKGAPKGGMPKYKYLANRALTFFQNTLLGQKLSEYHTGYRAFSAKVLKSINYEANSDDFIFDNQRWLKYSVRNMKLRKSPALRNILKRPHRSKKEQLLRDRSPSGISEV